MRRKCAPPDCSAWSARSSGSEPLRAAPDGETGNPSSIASKGERKDKERERKTKKFRKRDRAREYENERETVRETNRQTDI